MNEGLLRDLVDRQNTDGGWGALEGAPSDSECTALALLALNWNRRDADSARNGENWLLGRQEANGGWRYRDNGPVVLWPTPIVILALRHRNHDAAIDRGLEWLLAQKGEQMPLLGRIREFLSGTKVVELDTTLDGWPWSAGSFAWVEPTSWALMALKSVLSEVSRRGARGRVEEGERMLLDRACPDGGWNYGNKRVLDVELEPYPDTTAIALMALHGREAPEIEAGFHALDRLLNENASGLALALGALSHKAWARDPAALQTRLVGVYEQGRFLGETRTLALAALATEPGQGWFGRRRDA